jgi:hypothetical protein
VDGRTTEIDQKYFWSTRFPRGKTQRRAVDDARLRVGDRNSLESCPQFVESHVGSPRPGRRLIHFSECMRACTTIGMSVLPTLFAQACNPFVLFARTVVSYNFRIARDSGRNAEERYVLGTNPPPPSDGYPTQLPTRGERCTAAYLPLLDSGAFATQNKPQPICPDQAGIFNS